MSDAEGPNGRPAPVCEACRIRHRKCDGDDEACKPCKSIGLECVRQPTFRFRYDALQKKLPHAFQSHRRAWPSPHSGLTFCDETPALHEIYTGWEAVHPILPSTTVQQESAALGASPVQGLGTSPAQPLGTSPMQDTGFTPFHVAIGSDTSPITNATLSPGGQTSHIQGFTPSEARLIRNFADNMALWSDNVDPQRCFEYEVPRRALTEPLLKHAVCAFSARHYYRHIPDRDAEAESLNHQSKCLELLIPAISGERPITEVTLTAVSLLRQNEEMDEDDNRFHLEGTARILNSIPDFAASGGLAEAACWLCLRENIYIALTTQSPLTISPENFANSTCIRRDDDYSHGQRMVLHLAFLLNRTFTEPVSENALATSEAEIAEWNLLKPESYYPTLTIPRSRSEGRSFPEIWTLAPHHTIGLQYFHIAQIVLIIAQQRQRPSGNGRLFDTIAADRKRERQIRHHLLIIIGLAISNPKAENTLFTASHCLSVWAGCLRRREDQDAALGFLERMGARTGWKTSNVILALRRQWRDDSESG